MRITGFIVTRAKLRNSRPQRRALYPLSSFTPVFDLIEPLLACGVEILNPIQTSAARMDPAALKDRFGDRLTFWGGVDVQQFLPHAKPEEIPGHVRELAATLGRDGGYVMAPAHEIQDDVPPENIAAWIEAVRTPPDVSHTDTSKPETIG